MQWHELRDALNKESRLEHGKRPEYGYARITIDLGDPEYVGTDIPLTFSADALEKIEYTGSKTGTYFRLNDRHAQQIFPSELNSTTIPFTKIYFTNATAQPGKIFSFYLGSGIGARIRPSGKIDEFEDPNFPKHIRSIPPLMDTDTLTAIGSGATDVIVAPGAGHHLEIFGFVIDVENIAATGTGGSCYLASGSTKFIQVSITAETQTEHIIIPMPGIRVACADNTALTLTNCSYTGGQIITNVVVYYKDITD